MSVKFNPVITEFNTSPASANSISEEVTKTSVFDLLVNKKVLIALAIIAAAACVYWYYYKPPTAMDDDENTPILGNDKGEVSNISVRENQAMKLYPIETIVDEANHLEVPRSNSHVYIDDLSDTAYHVNKPISFIVEEPTEEGDAHEMECVECNKPAPVEVAKAVKPAPVEVEEVEEVEEISEDEVAPVEVEEVEVVSEVEEVIEEVPAPKPRGRGRQKKR